MKLLINKDKFLEAISKTEKITSKNSTLPVLSCVLLDTQSDLIKVKATNLDIGIVVDVPAKVEKTGVVAIPAGVLSTFISNLPKNDSEIDLEVKDNVLHITTKSTDTTIKTQDSDDFPDLMEDDLKDAPKINSEVFINGLKTVYYSASNSSIKPELSSVYIYSENNDLVFVATDSFRLAEKKITFKNDFIDNVLIPVKNVTEIIRVFDGINDDLKISIKEDQIILNSKNTYLVSRIIDGNFPDYKQIIPKEVKTEVNVLKEDLINALKVSNIFSGKFNQITFSVMPKDKIFETESNSEDVGESKNIIKSQLEGENIKINFNNKYINDSFNSIKTESLNMTFCGLDKPMIIKGSNDESFLYLVMPMNR
jgi:DNA polymerase-3 subunit beta